jgi:hypothetical protein
MSGRVAILVTAALVSLCSDSGDTYPEAASQPQPIVRRVTRDELKAAVATKHISATLQLLGPPIKRYDHGRKTILTYREVTINPATGLVDAQVEILFKDLGADAARYPNEKADYWTGIR